MVTRESPVDPLLILILRRLSMRLTIGVDAHKQIHMAVMLTATGGIHGTWCGPTTSAGWEEMLQWACSLAEERQWGIEGALNYGRGLVHAIGTVAPSTLVQVRPDHPRVSTTRCSLLMSSA